MVPVVPVAPVTSSGPVAGEALRGVVIGGFLIIRTRLDAYVHSVLPDDTRT
ncbi:MULTISPECIES: hypothetical protein [unclassified Streptomyces]|uniref:hypothetical protein n=1 Tax=unclassified Streptomyces TaxID=2593676 RepID=UPI003677F443